MSDKRIKSALISVFDKDGLDDIIPLLIKNNVKVYSTGGTQVFLEKHGVTVHRVEDLTSYPSILGGRVKTLHPKVFGGILAKRDDDHLSQIEKYEIPEIDLVVVDLYPFEDTVASTDDEAAIIEKIDIGGIALIRGAAKNFNDVTVIPSKEEYPILKEILENDATVCAKTRKALARQAFNVSSHYDSAIFNYFLSQDEEAEPSFKTSYKKSMPLRYGENPHQSATFFGDLDKKFDILNGKPLSFNNLVDVDAAVALIQEFKDEKPTFAVLKHTNACGIATRDDVLTAWKDALAADNISAFGGILITNATVDLATAKEIDTLFYEVLIARDFDQDALELLSKKKNRILLKQLDYSNNKKAYKTILNGVVEQCFDSKIESSSDFNSVTNRQPTEQEEKDLVFANKVAKHLKSNTIAIVKNGQLLGMGCGQTSRIDACRQAIEKAHKFGFDTTGSVLASDAFFPFPDCVEVAHEHGIVAVVQPGGSKNDKLSIDFCNDNNIAMVMTGIRHFKH